MVTATVTFTGFYAFYVWWFHFPQSGALAEDTSQPTKLQKKKANISLGICFGVFLVPVTVMMMKATLWDQCACISEEYKLPRFWGICIYIHTIAVCENGNTVAVTVTDL